MLGILIALLLVVIALIIALIPDPVVRVKSQKSVKFSDTNTLRVIDQTKAAMLSTVSTESVTSAPLEDDPAII